MQEALEDKYTVAIVDSCTNLISIDILAALDYLFYNFGKVTSEEVNQKEAEIMAMTWLLSNPIIMLTKPIEELNKLAHQAGIPCIQVQILEKALSIIRAARDFELALTN